MIIYSIAGKKHTVAHRHINSLTKLKTKSKTFVLNFVWSELNS